MRKYRKMKENLDKEFNDLKENLNEVQRQSENFISINEKILIKNLQKKQVYLIKKIRFFYGLLLLYKH